MFGGAVFDRKYQALQPLVAGTSNPVAGSHSHGGVARNVAENLARLGVPVSFSSIVGRDDTGAMLLKQLEDLGVDLCGVARGDELPTAEYAAILDTTNDLALGIADMAILDLYAPDDLDRGWKAAAAARWVFADCNLPGPVLADLAARCRGAGKPFAVNTVSTPKAVKLLGTMDRIAVLFTNRGEAHALLGSAGDAPHAADAAKALRQTGVDAAIVTDGGAGYAVLSGGAVTRHDAAPARPVDITGAGDAMIAGTLARLMAGDRLVAAARCGAWLAARTTETTDSVLRTLSPQLFAEMTGLPGQKG